MYYLKQFFKFIFICMDVLPMYTSIYCVPGTCGGQKRALDPQELELEMVVCSHMGAGTQPSPGRASTGSG